MFVVSNGFKISFCVAMRHGVEQIFPTRLCAFTVLLTQRGVHPVVLSPSRWRPVGMLLLAVFTARWKEMGAHRAYLPLPHSALLSHSMSLISPSRPDTPSF